MAGGSVGSVNWMSSGVKYPLAGFRDFTNEILDYRGR
jgi:hypothetical protein